MLTKVLRSLCCESANTCMVCDKMICMLNNIIQHNCKHEKPTNLEIWKVGDLEILKIYTCRKDGDLENIQIQNSGDLEIAH